MDDTANMLKTLTEAHGIPGHEVEIRAIIKELLDPLGDLGGDHLGSVICGLQGIVDAPRVMLAGHMDEIGFMVRHITDEGFLRFLPLGGWWDQVLLGQRVVVKTRLGDVTGIIGAKPPHLLPSDERDKLVKKDQMYIDIGASSKEEVDAAGVRMGDPVVPQAFFEELTVSGRYLSKAFDDRVGVALVVDALRTLQDREHPNAVFGAITTMEEVGLRGATTSVDVVDPDVAIILESDIAGDVPGIKPEQSAVKLGQGPTVLLVDGRMIPNLALRDLVMDTAAELGIRLQTSALATGTTDGAAIHLHKQGVPTVVIGVAARHIHSHGAIIDRQDYDNALTLLTAVVRRLNADMVAGLVPD